MFSFSYRNIDDIIFFLFLSLLFSSPLLLLYVSFLLFSSLFSPFHFNIPSGRPSKVFGLDQDDLRNDSAKESIEFAGDDDNRNPYRVDDVACVDADELTVEALEKERNR